MSRRFVFAGLTLAVLAGLAYWQFPNEISALWGKKVEPVKEQSARGPAIPVTAITAEIGTAAIEERSIGTVQPFATVQIKSRVDGVISKVHFREGDMVKAGDTLFTIDPRSFEAQLRQAEANLARDEAQLANARTETKRLEATTPSGITPRKALDQARATEASLEATVKASQAAVDVARVQLSYTSIQAPLSGRTGELRADEGNLVKASDAAPLVTINQLRPINVDFSMPERLLPEIRARQHKSPLRISLIDNRGVRHPEQGQLTFIDNAIDQATGTIQLKGTFANDRDFLWPGQFVQVLLRLHVREDAIILPPQAVQTGQQGRFVYVVRADSTAEMRPVKLGAQVETGVIVESGLQPGEMVVTDGHVRVVPDARLQVRTEGPPRQPPPPAPSTRSEGKT